MTSRGQKRGYRNNTSYSQDQKRIRYGEESYDKYGAISAYDSAHYSTNFSSGQRRMESGEEKYNKYGFVSKPSPRYSDSYSLGQNRTMYNDKSGSSYGTNQPDDFFLCDDKATSRYRGSRAFDPPSYADDYSDKAGNRYQVGRALDTPSSCNDYDDKAGKRNQLGRAFSAPKYSANYNDRAGSGYWVSKAFDTPRSPDIYDYKFNNKYEVGRAFDAPSYFDDFSQDEKKMFYTEESFNTVLPGELAESLLPSVNSKRFSHTQLYPPGTSKEKKKQIGKQYAITKFEKGKQASPGQKQAYILYITNLHPLAKLIHVIEHFKDVKNIVTVKMPNRRINQKRAYRFAQMELENEEALKAALGLDKTVLLGHRISVCRSERKVPLGGPSVQQIIEANKLNPVKPIKVKTDEAKPVELPPRSERLELFQNEKKRKYKKKKNQKKRAGM